MSGANSLAQAPELVLSIFVMGAAQVLSEYSSTRSPATPRPTSRTACSRSRLERLPLAIVIATFSNSPAAGLALRGGSSGVVMSGQGRVGRIAERGSCAQARRTRVPPNPPIARLAADGEDAQSLERGGEVPPRLSFPSSHPFCGSPCACASSVRSRAAQPHPVLPYLIGQQAQPPRRREEM